MGHPTSQVRRRHIGDRASAAFLAAGMTLMASAQQPTPTATPAAATTAPAPRPDQSPVVAIGSRIAWNVPYAQASPLQTLDVYTPVDAKSAPIVLFVHGGEWAKGDKAEVSCKPKFLNENGIVFASMNYRLSPADRHPAQVDDVAAAVRWLRDHAGEYGGDGRRIVLLGHSAGTHLVTLLALDPRPLARAGLTPADLHGVVAWSGSAYDLVAKHAEGGDNKPYIEQNFGADAAAMRDASPMAHVGDGKGLPRFLFASPEQSRSPLGAESAARLCTAIVAAGGKAETVMLPGKTHFTANHELGMKNGGEAIGAILLEFLRR